MNFTCAMGYKFCTPHSEFRNSSFTHCFVFHKVCKCSLGCKANINLCYCFVILLVQYIQFTILYIVYAELKTDFFTNLCISFPDMSCKSSARNIIIGSSVWYFTRNGFRTLEMYTKTCSLASTSISLVTFCIVQ